MNSTEAYKKLTERQKEIVQKYIENNIDSVFDERYAYGTIMIQTLEFIGDPDLKEEYVEHKFVGYYCNKCGDYVATTDNDLILHVIKDIEEYADEYEWEV